jgi:hypothetical protein
LTHKHALGLKHTVERAVVAGWLPEDAGVLLVEWAEAEVEWHGNKDACLTALRRKISSLQAARSNHPYRRYLDRGITPHNSAGHLDWKVRDSYTHIERSIEITKSLLDRFLEKFQNGDTDLQEWRALNLAVEAHKLLHALEGTATQTLRQQPSLAAQDYVLCLAWAGVKDAPVLAPTRAVLIEKLGHYEAGKLESARAAELCMSTYYTDLGNVVEDVSISQLTQGESRWMDYDLRVGDKPIDVKNARRSFSSPDSYVEHAVPAFKLARGSGKEVSIGGVLSDYLCGSTPEGKLGRSVRILGEVRLTYLQGLLRWMQKRFGAILDLEKVWKPDFQAGWVFEYPSEHYPERADAIARIPDFLRSAVDAHVPRKAFIGWLTTLHPGKSNHEMRFLTSPHKRIRADLRHLAREVGLARPGIYLYVMGFVLEAMAGRLPISDVESVLRNSIFARFGGDCISKPLGLEDPQGYVARLLDALLSIYKEVLRRNLIFASFKLTHPEILRGVTHDTTWLTLLAYCGGWRQRTLRVKCGTTPLILGIHEPCDSCGYLVCPNCGCCKRDCPEGNDRQNRIRDQRRFF